MLLIDLLLNQPFGQRRLGPCAGFLQRVPLRQLAGDGRSQRAAGAPVPVGQARGVICIVPPRLKQMVGADCSLRVATLD